MSTLVNSEYAVLAGGLLAQLTDEDLQDLVSTATGRRGTYPRQESCQIILQHCLDVGKLLSFRKITKEVLENYLSSQRVVFKPNRTRTELHFAVSGYWNQQVEMNRRATCPNLTLTEPRWHVPADQGVPMEPRNTQQQSNITDVIPQENSVSNKVHFAASFGQFCLSCDLSLGDTRDASLFGTNVNISVNNDSVAINFSIPSTNLQAQRADKLFPANANILDTNDSGRINISLSSSHIQPPFQAPTSNIHVCRASVRSDIFSLEYCKWFYSMLNNLQSRLCNQSGNNLTSNVFSFDCKMEIYLFKEGRQEVFKADRGSNCETTIRDLLLKLSLGFFPNTKDGLQARKLSHGGIQLSCCGRLKYDNSFYGVFEQEFNLMLSSVDKTWIITDTRLNLRNDYNADCPILQPCEIFTIEE